MGGLRGGAGLSNRVFLVVTLILIVFILQVGRRLFSDFGIGFRSAVLRRIAVLAGLLGRNVVDFLSWSVVPDVEIEEIARGGQFEAGESAAEVAVEIVLPVVFEHGGVRAWVGALVGLGWSIVIVILVVGLFSSARLG